MTCYTADEIMTEAAETLAASHRNIEDAERALYWAEWRYECAESDIEGECGALEWNGYYEAAYNLGIAEENAEETASLFIY